jgi:L-arabinonolactonase
MKVDLVANEQAILGECPIWCDRSYSLWWTDIEGSRLHRKNTLTSTIDTWKTPDRVASFALTQDANRLILGFASGIGIFDLARSELVNGLIPVESEQPATRINDGRCDAEGRFVFGMFNQVSSAALGGFYRVHTDLSVERLKLPAAAVANSIAFSPDGRRIYFTDSPQWRIWCAKYEASGKIGAVEVFADLSSEQGVPDGSCVDAEGGLWNAQWDGSCLIRFDASGRITHRVTLPVTRPTCPAIGGKKFDRLYVTSARVGLNEHQLHAQPLAGAILSFSPDVPGQPERRFGV